MKILFAPMEGITGVIYRRAHHQVFGHIDTYYAPFVFTNPNGKISKKDRLEIGPENNPGFDLVPQFLSNDAVSFSETAKVAYRMGFEMVNLNLGCPSSTVVNKGRGAGFLAHPEKLDAFLDEVFERLSKEEVKISLKTRIGMHDRDEFEKLLDVYEKYPLAELIIHPRIRDHFYNGTPDRVQFDRALERKMAFPVIYNGDINTVEDYKQIVALYGDRTDSVMIGRGLLANPALGRMIKGGEGLNNSELAEFFMALSDGYEERLQGNKKTVFLLKEQWRYWRYLMNDEDKAMVSELMLITDKQDFMKQALMIAQHCRLDLRKGFGR